MTILYFIRHAEPNYENHDDFTRELTHKGLQSSKEIVNLFDKIQIDAFYSSPYIRSVDTIRPLAESRGQVIHRIADFRERKITDYWIEDFTDFTERQWADFNYHLSGGESLAQVQKRNIEALQNLLNQHEDETIIIGTHGTALSTVINYYNPNFQLKDFQRIKNLFPWIVKFTFQETTCLTIDEIY